LQAYYQKDWAMTHPIQLQDRTEAGHRLAERLQGRIFIDPLVLAVPRGGIVVGAAVARDLEADFDVLLARKLRAPYNPEVAVGAVAESGFVYINERVAEEVNLGLGYLNHELRFQTAELQRRARLFRGIRPPAPIAGRSVIVVDDGIATGATMIAALQATRAQNPHELIVAVPVAAADRLPKVKRWCDEVVCLSAPDDLTAVGQYYDDFHEVEDEEAVALVSDFADDIPAVAHNER
jgi:predicted phosphoribosyltransferase